MADNKGNESSFVVANSCESKSLLRGKTSMCECVGVCVCVFHAHADTDVHMLSFSNKPKQCYLFGC